MDSKAIDGQQAINGQQIKDSRPLDIKRQERARIVNLCGRADPVEYHTLSTAIPANTPR